MSNLAKLWQAQATAALDPAPPSFITLTVNQNSIKQRGRILTFVDANLKLVRVVFSFNTAAISSGKSEGIVDSQSCSTGVFFAVRCKPFEGKARNSQTT